jgi:hypothetical protein
MSILSRSFSRQKFLKLALIATFVSFINSVNAQCIGANTPCTASVVTVTSTPCASPVNVGIGSGCTSTGGSGGCWYQGNRRDTWITFTTTSVQDIAVYLEPGDNRDVMLHLYNSSVPCSGNPSSAEIACEDSNGWGTGAAGSETLVYNSLPIGTYYARIQSYNSNFLSSSSFVCVYAYTPPVCESSDDPCGSTVATVSTTGCDAPLNVGLSSNCSASGGSGGCGFQSGNNDVWVSFSTTSDMDLTVYFEPLVQNADISLNLYSTSAGCDVGSLSEIDCADDNWGWGTGSSYSEQIDVTGLPAGDYVVRIQEWYDGNIDIASFICIYGTPLVGCQEIISQLDSSTPAAGANGIDICQGDQITFNGSGNYTENGLFYTQDDATSTFTWDFGDGTSQSGVGLTSVTHTYNDQGGYLVQLQITDVMGCTNTNYISQKVRVSLTPLYIPLSSDKTICFGNQTLLGANAYDPTWTQNCSPVASDTLLLPDGVGNSYESVIFLDCYDPGQTLDDINDLYGIYANLEHSWLGDLLIEVECPTGQTVTLKNYPGGGGTFLGEPVSLGSPDANSGDLTMGNGYFYSWANTPTYGTMVGEAGNYQYSYVDNGGNPHNNQNYLPAGSYTSASPLSGLVGCELNGNWTLRVTDNLALDNGYAFSFLVVMDPGLLPSAWSFTTNVVTEGWLPDPTIIAYGVNNITVQPDARNRYPLRRARRYYLQRRIIKTTRPSHRHLFGVEGSSKRPTQPYLARRISIGKSLH